MDDGEFWAFGGYILYLRAGLNNDKACGAVAGLILIFAVRGTFSKKLVRVNYSIGSEFIILLTKVICGEMQ